MTVQAPTITFPFPPSVTDVPAGVFAYLWDNGSINDRTAVANTSAADAVATIAWTAGQADIIMSAPGVPFGAINVVVSAATLTAGASAWEYSTGPGTWAAIPGIVASAGVLDFRGTNSTTLVAVFDPAACTGWADVTIGAYTGRAVRRLVTVTYNATTSTLTQASIGVQQLFTRTVQHKLAAGRTVTNAWLDVSWYTAATAGAIAPVNGFITVNGVRTQLTPAAATSFSSSGEPYTVRRYCGVTSAFVGNLVGESTAVSLELYMVQGASVAAENTLQNVNVELHINATFDETTETDAQATYAYHVQSLMNNLTTAFQTLGTVPAHALPTGYVQQHAWLVVEANSYSKNAASTYRLVAQVDSDPEIQSGEYNNTGIGGTLVRQIFELPSFDLTAAHDIKLRLTADTGVRFDFVSARVMVTHSWSANSARMLSSFTKLMGMTPRMSAGLPQGIECALTLSETNPVVYNAACALSWNWAPAVSGAASLIVQLSGEGASTTYTVPTTGRSGLSGSSTLTRNFPAAPVYGRNSVAVTVNGATIGADHVAANACIAYAHDTPSQGWWRAPHTYKALASAFVTSNGYTFQATTALAAAKNFMSDRYQVEDLYLDTAVVTATTGYGSSIFITLIGGEGFGSVQAMGWGLSNISEFGIRKLPIPMRPMVAQWPNDTRPTTDVTANADVGQSRPLFLNMTQVAQADMVVCSVLRGQNHTISGTLVNYTGDGSGINISVYDAGSRQILTVGTSIIGGTFSIPWHDPATPVFVTVRQDATHKIRSDNFTPGTPVTLDLAPSASVPSVTSITMGGM